MNQFAKLAVIGLTAFAFTACNGNSTGTGSEAAEVAIATLDDIGGYAVNVSSALLSEDDNFNIYFCYGDYFLDNGDFIGYAGSAAVLEEVDTSLNVWDAWPDNEADVNIITADTVNPGYLVEGVTYDLEWYDDDMFAGTFTVNVIEPFDCSVVID